MERISRAFWNSFKENEQQQQKIVESDNFLFRIC